MPDDTIIVKEGDSKRIIMTEEYAIQDWSKKFRVSIDMLKRAVIEVGNDAKHVEEFLKNNKN